jgi:hypothetical protein
MDITKILPFSGRLFCRSPVPTIERKSHRKALFPNKFIVPKTSKYIQDMPTTAQVHRETAQLVSGSKTREMRGKGLFFTAKRA